MADRNTEHLRERYFALSGEVADLEREQAVAADRLAQSEQGVREATAALRAFGLEGEADSLIEGARAKVERLRSKADKLAEKVRGHLKAAAQAAGDPADASEEEE